MSCRRGMCASAENFRAAFRLPIRGCLEGALAHACPAAFGSAFRRSTSNSYGVPADLHL